MAEKSKLYVVMTYWLWQSNLFDVVCHFLSATSDRKDCQNWGVKALQKISRQPKFCQMAMMTVIF